MQRRDGEVARNRAAGRAGADPHPPRVRRPRELRDRVCRRARAAVAAPGAREREIDAEAHVAHERRADQRKAGQSLAGPRSFRKGSERAGKIQRQRPRRVTDGGREHRGADARPSGISHCADAQAHRHLGRTRARWESAASAPPTGWALRIRRRARRACESWNLLHLEKSVTGSSDPPAHSRDNNTARARLRVISPSQVATDVLAVSTKRAALSQTYANVSATTSSASPGSITMP